MGSGWFFALSIGVWGEACHRMLGVLRGEATRCATFMFSESGEMPISASEMYVSG